MICTGLHAENHVERATSLRNGCTRLRRTFLFHFLNIYSPKGIFAAPLFDIVRVRVPECKERNHCRCIHDFSDTG